MKRTILITILCLSFAARAQEQMLLNLDQCKDMAIKQNRELEMKREEITAAEALKKEAFAAYLPKFDLAAGYLHLSDKFSLISQDKFLPIGTVANGSFRYTEAAWDNGVLKSPDLNNNFVDLGGNYVPLDNNGVPFNPLENPEKLQWKNYTTIPKDELTVDMRNVLLGTVSLVQPIYMGGKVRKMNKMAQLGVDISKQQEQQQVSEILYNVESSYWLVISVGQKLKVAEDYSKLLTQLSSDVEKLAAEGMATKSDILKVRVKYNEVNMSLTQAQNGLQLAKMSLCQQLGLPLDTDITLADESPKTLDSANIVQADVQKAIENRTELQSLASLVKITDTKIGLAQADRLPNIGLTANFMASNIDFFNGFEKEFATSWNVGVMMKIPIWHWGGNVSKVKQARSEKKIAELKQQDATEKIELQVTQANFKMIESLKKLASTEKNLEEAKENLRYAKLAFEEGIANISTMLEAQAAWYSANSDNTDAMIEVQMCNTFLKKVTGDLGMPQKSEDDDSSKQ